MTLNDTSCVFMFQSIGCFVW